MRTQLLSLLFALFIWLPGCKKPAMPEVDPNPPQRPANCRIIKTTYKTPTIVLDPKSPLILEPETITLDAGDKLQISFITGTTYKYDGQGRVTEVREQLLEGDYRLMKYVYTSATITIVTETMAHYVSNKPYFAQDTIPLNEQGLVTRQSGLG